MRTRLYLITPPMFELDVFASQLDETLELSDVACIQLRLKQANNLPVQDDMIMKYAERLYPIAHKHKVSFIINDRPDIALKIRAEGVHLGQGDISYTDARKCLGEEAIIGVTCHNSRHLAMQAGEEGADYVAFGAFYDSTTKHSHRIAHPDLLYWWQMTMHSPCVAVGGITVHNAEILVSAGADFLAVSSGVWQYEQGAVKAVQKFNEIFEKVKKE